MRYSIMMLIDKILIREVNRCVFCGRKLTNTEKKYYENTCEKCERKWLKKVSK